MPITTLIDGPDAVEVLRDEVAAILALESAAQQALAVQANRDPDDWKLRVFIERTNPWAEFVDTPETDTNTERAAPIVNVWFDNETFDARTSSVVDRQKATAVFNIDCYGYGVSSVDGAGQKAGDELAAREMQRAVRLVRNILMAAEYTYLGHRGLVWRRFITSVTAFQPTSDVRAVQHIQAARVALEVNFNEFAPQVEGQPLELIAVTMKRADNGQIIAQTDFPYPL